VTPASCHCTSFQQSIRKRLPTPSRIPEASSTAGLPPYASSPGNTLRVYFHTSALVTFTLRASALPIQRSKFPDRRAIVDETKGTDHSRAESTAPVALLTELSTLLRLIRRPHCGNSEYTRSALKGEVFTLQNFVL
jgi:hypothetical protein